MLYDRKDFSDDKLIEVYKNILLPRLIEERMLLLLRQGKISKWFSGIGQEAIPVGVTYVLETDEWIMPLHRNLGVFTGRNMPLHKLFLQWQGNTAGYSKGRERSFHFGSAKHHICGMISHLGPQLTIANGTALAAKLRNEKKVSVAFTGEGGTSEGDFHEALNVAAVWELPVIFIIENNGYGLSTPVSEQYKCNQLADRARGYGMESVVIDGNNILAVIDTIKGVREYCLEKQKPYLVECMTFRMRGHEEASGTKYVPQHLLEEWKRKDPVENFEYYLLDTGVINHTQIETIHQQFKSEIDRELELANSFGDLQPGITTELQDVYFAPDEKIPTQIVTKTANEPVSRFKKPIAELNVNNKVEANRSIRYVDAISEALKLSMQKDPQLILMGQDIAEYGGAFKVTAGLSDEFGKERVRNTPLCESAIVGAALGLSLEGYKSVVEMQFADFVSVAFNQIVNNLAKIHYRWGQAANVVIRMPTGAGVGAGPFHSQSNEAWFVHTPGLKVVYPSDAYSAKGLLIAAINDPNPVMFFEHKGLYRSNSGNVPEGIYEVEIGKAKTITEGNDISIITYGMGVHWALNYSATNPEYSLHIIDLQTLLPLDFEAIKQAVIKTGKVLILHEDTLTGGIGGEIAAWISEHCFEWLDAPVLRCASLDTPVPFNLTLEKQFLANSRLDEFVKKLIYY
ncbi:MAG: dehydrogenase E1 component subunit alpha/beta [Bacteroidota bacterium]